MFTPKLQVINLFHTPLLITFCLNCLYWDKWEPYFYSWICNLFRLPLATETRVTVTTERGRRAVHQCLKYSLRTLLSSHTAMQPLMPTTSRDLQVRNTFQINLIAHLCHFDRGTKNWFYFFSQQIFKSPIFQLCFWPSLCLFTPQTFHLKAPFYHLKPLLVSLLYPSNSIILPLCHFKPILIPYTIDTINIFRIRYSNRSGKSL